MCSRNEAFSEGIPQEPSAEMRPMNLPFRRRRYPGITNQLTGTATSLKNLPLPLFGREGNIHLPKPVLFVVRSRNDRRDFISAVFVSSFLE